MYTLIYIYIRHMEVLPCGRMKFVYCLYCLIEDLDVLTTQYMGVSKNRGTPKWMVYNGKPGKLY